MSAQGPSTPLSLAETFRTADLASTSATTKESTGFRSHVGLEFLARRTLGIILLLITVFLWTGSNFLASYMFADNTYSKPYFVTYVNTSFFAISLLPIFLKIAYQRGYRNTRLSLLNLWNRRVQEYRQLGTKLGENNDETLNQSTTSDTHLFADEEINVQDPTTTSDAELEDLNAVLSVRATMFLSLEFCLLWFIANYFVAACLEYTSVASSTILTSTSSIWTLVFGAVAGVERFTIKKLIGVLASLAGIILISSLDLSGNNDENRGSFPHKSTNQIAIGDSMAFFSALMYGVYTVVMKKRIGNEDRVNMPLFFGMVGLFNVVFLWPGFLILHFTGVETFELPPTGKILTIVLLNSASSFVSDYCWAYAMLLTTPLVVTVGLSLTIPLSLIGQMIISSQYSSALYWIGAFIVFLSFLFINHESQEEDEVAMTSNESPNTAG